MKVSDGERALLASNDLEAPFNFIDRLTELAHIAKKAKGAKRRRLSELGIRNKHQITEGRMLSVLAGVEV